MRNGVCLDDCPKATILATLRDRDRIAEWGRSKANRISWKNRYGYSPDLTAMRLDELRGEGRDVEWNASHE